VTAQLSLEDAEAGRDEGLRVVTENAGELWRDEARAWLYGFLRANAIYLPDAAWCHGCPEPPNTRKAFGAIIRYAVAPAQKWMVHEGYRPRLSGHATPGPYYRSLIYRGAS
jgi:hypothetical protein